MDTVSEKVVLNLPREALIEFCRRWQVNELALFGSALRDDFGLESDVDILISFAPDGKWSVFDLVRMQDELSILVQRPVDLVTRNAVERSANWIRRRAILESARVIYAAR